MYVCAVLFLWLFLSDEHGKINSSDSPNNEICSNDFRWIIHKNCKQSKTRGITRSTKTSEIKSHETMRFWLKIGCAYHFGTTQQGLLRRRLHHQQSHAATIHPSWNLYQSPWVISQPSNNPHHHELTINLPHQSTITNQETCQPTACWTSSDHHWFHLTHQSRDSPSWAILMHDILFHPKFQHPWPAVHPHSPLNSGFPNFY